MEVSEQGEMAIALRNRPDLQDAKVGLESEEFRTKVARNEMLPAVSLTGSAGLGGLAPGYGDALDELKSGNSPFWSIGVALSFPLGNDAAKADLAAGLLHRITSYNVCYTKLLRSVESMETFITSSPILNR